MYYKLLLICSLFSTSPLLAFQDSDIDGVDDSIDLCPNSSFDLLVDPQGCASNQTANKKPLGYYGELTLKIGSTLRTDEYYEDENYLDLYANYRYQQWDISISNSQSTTKSSTTEDNSDSDNDIYLSTGYSFALPSSKIRLSIGAKIVDNEEDSSSSSTDQGRGTGRYSQESIPNEESSIEDRDNDYFAGINYSYSLNNQQDIFAYYGYTQSGDSTGYDYEDYSSFSVGTGYAFSPKIYTAISYNYTGSIYKDADAEERITAYGSYSFNKNIFTTASYSYGLDDYSYDHAFSLALGFYFQ